ncbi:MAG: protein kinase, partial [Isosphaeraceae bacterium]
MDFGELSLTVQHEIDQACDAFEAAWRGEVRPRVEDFLGEANGRMRAGRLAQLIAMEIQLRRREGERPNPDEYLARFPGDSVIVLSAFQRTVEVGDTDGDFLGSGAAGTPSVPATPGLTQPRPPSTLPPVEPVGSPGFEPIPDRIGKFQDIRRIGWGGFAVVYLARDPDLKREVALKVPRQGALGRYDEALLIDAISAAKLSHPGIVRIYELVRLHQGGLVIAMEYVAGTTLEKRLRTERLSPAHAAGLIRRVAEAVQHAHEHGLVHRDLKPSNVLIDLKGEPKVTDFGLAVGGETQGVPGEVAGTPAYMAPEQVRGETHRIDARTDVWALGVILYRALTGELPFPSRERAEVFDEVLHREPPSPRRINPELPSELARITTRCLSKRMDDRYESAAELAEDLADWLSADLRGLPDWTITDSGREGIGGLPDLGPAVLSKGLRPYDGEDAGYFLGLIPGPRVRGGFPESLRFWKARIESRESRTGSQTPRAFRVGLLHGPSGGGKSSIVRAGLLPRLDTMIRRVYVEASPATTEDRLLTELRQEVPGLDPQADLPKSVAAIREWRAGLEPSAKVLLVLDQFEQWLQAHPLLDQNMPLVRALRQCDGVRAQALILVRDDFWGPIWRFFKALEVPLAEGDNAASVELPDAAHARRVLVEFGRACDRLPKSDPPGPVACRFLDEAVAGLCGPDGRVVPVRLSLFNEVARRHEWTHATLRRLGGMSGIGLTYLKQTFDQPSAPAPYHARRRAAQRVLQALLPAPGAVIRGIVRPATHLGETAGLADRPHDRDELLRMLDSELRLITEVDPQGTEDGDTPGAGDAGDATASAPGERYYQLAHDDLVSSVRTWLEEEERSTSAGRARLRLATITAVWTDSPGTKRLPSLTEWLGILWHVPPGLWSAESRRMMLSASWHHARRVATAWVILIAVTLLGRLWQRQVAAESRVAQVLGFDLSALPSLFPELERDRDALIPALREAEAHPGPSAGRKRNALVLLYRFEPTPERARALRDLACVAEADDLSVLREVLASRPQAALNDDLWRILGDSSTDAPTRLRAASTLARLDPGASGWRTHASTLALDLLAEERGGLTRWFSLLDPVASVMVPALAESLVMTEPQPPVFREVTLALTERRR